MGTDGEHLQNTKCYRRPRSAIYAAGTTYVSSLCPLIFFANGLAGSGSAVLALRTPILHVVVLPYMRPAYLSRPLFAQRRKVVHDLHDRAAEDGVDRTALTWPMKQHGILSHLASFAERGLGRRPRCIGLRPHHRPRTILELSRGGGARCDRNWSIECRSSPVGAGRSLQLPVGMRRVNEEGKTRSLLIFRIALGPLDWYTKLGDQTHAPVCHVLTQQEPCYILFRRLFRRHSYLDSFSKVKVALFKEKYMSASKPSKHIKILSRPVSSTNEGPRAQ